MNLFSTVECRLSATQIGVQLDTVETVHSNNSIHTVPLAHVSHFYSPAMPQATDLLEAELRSHRGGKSDR